MVFQPVIPLSGFGGWNFLQSTYDAQLETFSKSAQIKNDIDYLTEKFAEPMAVEDFLSDGRLRRITMTAYGLAGEEWKTGYVRTVLDEVQDPASTFLARLNKPVCRSPAPSRWRDPIDLAGPGTHHGAIRS